jgi:LssY C-terminus
MSALKWILILIFAVLSYAGIAYLLLPKVWRHYEHQPALALKPMITHTEAGIPGDPLNVGFVGQLQEILEAMEAAGWSRADPITIRSGVKVAESVVLDRSYTTAPVSNLYYEGRKEDVAFEKQIGASPAQRHHARFWKVLEKGIEGRNVWLGSATLDRNVGFSKYTGQITHHIDSDIDTEREQLIGDLTRAQRVTTIYSVSGVGPTLNGRNGEGDWYYTDGDIHIAVISASQTRKPAVLEQPLPVSVKNQIWRAVRLLQ